MTFQETAAIQTGFVKVIAGAFSCACNTKRYLKCRAILLKVCRSRDTFDGFWVRRGATPKACPLYRDYFKLARFEVDSAYVPNTRPINPEMFSEQFGHDASNITVFEKVNSAARVYDVRKTTAMYSVPNDLWTSRSFTAVWLFPCHSTLLSWKLGNILVYVLPRQLSCTIWFNRWWSCFNSLDVSMLHPQDNGVNAVHERIFHIKHIEPDSVLLFSCFLWMKASTTNMAPCSMLLVLTTYIGGSFIVNGWCPWRKKTVRLGLLQWKSSQRPRKETFWSLHPCSPAEMVSVFE